MNETLTRSAGASPAAPSTTAAGAPHYVPPVDVFESEKEYLLVADVPGATQDTVRIHLEAQRLTVEADRPAPDFGKPVGRARAEDLAARYRRTFIVPTTVDASAIEAKLAGGVLRVRLPKSAAHQPRRIEVRAG